MHHLTVIPLTAGENLGERSRQGETRRAELMRMTVAATPTPSTPSTITTTNNNNKPPTQPDLTPIIVSLLNLTLLSRPVSHTEILTSILTGQTTIEPLSPTIRRAFLDLCLRGLATSQVRTEQWAFARAFCQYAMPIDALELGPFLLSLTPYEDVIVHATFFSALTLLCSRIPQTTITPSLVISKSSSTHLSSSRLARLNATSWWPLTTSPDPALGNHFGHVVGHVQFKNGAAFFPPSTFLAVPFSPHLNCMEFSVETQIRVNAVTLVAGVEHIFLSSGIVSMNDTPKGWEMSVTIQRPGMSQRGEMMMFSFRAGEDRISALLPASSLSSSISSSSPAPDWIHVQCCRSNHRLYMVLNHGEVYREQATRIFKPNTDAPMYIGSAPAPKGRFEGNLANVVVYSQCLMKDDGTNMMDEGMDTPQPPRTTTTTTTDLPTSPNRRTPVTPRLSPIDAVKFLLSALSRSETFLAMNNNCLSAILSMRLHNIAALEGHLIFLLQHARFGDDGNNGIDMLTNPNVQHSLLSLPSSVLARMFSGGLITSPQLVLQILDHLKTNATGNESAMRAGQQCLYGQHAVQWTRQLMQEFMKKIDDVCLLRLVNECCAYTFSNGGLHADKDMVDAFFVVANRKGGGNDEENSLLWNMALCLVHVLSETNQSGLSDTWKNQMDADLVTFLCTSDPQHEVEKNTNTLFAIVKDKYPLPLVHRARFVGKPDEDAVWKALQHTFEVMVMGEEEEESAWRSTWSILPFITSRRQQGANVHDLCDTVIKACHMMLARGGGGRGKLVVTFIQACLAQDGLLQNLDSTTQTALQEVNNRVNVFHWIEKTLRAANIAIALKQHLFDLVCNCVLTHGELAGPTMLTRYETARKRTVLAGLQEFSGQMPDALALKVALQSELVINDDDSGGGGVDLVFDMCKGLLLNNHQPPHRNLLIASSSLPRTSGLQWISGEEVDGDGLVLRTPQQNGTWRQPIFHVGTHGMLSGMFYVEMTTSSSLSTHQRDVVVLALGLTTRPQTQTFDCGCRVHLAQGDGVGMLVDLNRGVVSFHWVSQSEIQPTRSTRRIVLGGGENPTYQCDVPTTRPVYFAVVILSEECEIRSVFAENAEEQVVGHSSNNTDGGGMVVMGSAGGGPQEWNGEPNGNGALFF